MKRLAKERLFAATRVGMATGDNDRFVRLWYEVPKIKIGFGLSREAAKDSGCKWFPYSNGGEARKWYANYLHVVDWENDGHVLQTEKHESGRIRAHNFNLDRIFQPGLTWSLINASYNAIRVLPEGFLFSSGAPSLFCNNASDLRIINGFYNSAVAQYFLRAISPTMNNNSGDADKLPLRLTDAARHEVEATVGAAVDEAKRDWDSYEISWDFAALPLIQTGLKRCASAYSILRETWRNRVETLRDIETSNNRIIAREYDLEDEVLSQETVTITLTCNPKYRYDEDKSESELEALLLADTMREFISYAVGCMLGRYSLDKPGAGLCSCYRTQKVSCV